MYLYQIADNETTMREYGVQAVVCQTAVTPIIALELIEMGAGVPGPDAFDPDAFLARMAEYDFPYGIQERTNAPK